MGSLRGNWKLQHRLTKSPTAQRGALEQKYLVRGSCIRQKWPGSTTTVLLSCWLGPPWEQCNSANLEESIRNEREEIAMRKPVWTKIVISLRSCTFIGSWENQRNCGNVGFIPLPRLWESTGKSSGLTQTSLQTFYFILGLYSIYVHLIQKKKIVRPILSNFGPHSSLYEHFFKTIF